MGDADKGGTGRLAAVKPESSSAAGQLAGVLERAGLTPELVEGGAKLIGVLVREAAHGAGESSSGASQGAVSRVIIRTLVVAVLALSIGILGVVQWSLAAHIGDAQSAIGELERSALAMDARLEDQDRETAANFKLLAGHAVGLAIRYNAQSNTNYELLMLLVREAGVEDDVPASAAPEQIDPPVGLKVLAGQWD